MSDDKSPLDSDTIEPKIVPDGEVEVGILLIQSYPGVDPKIADEIFRKGSVVGYKTGHKRGFREGFDMAASRSAVLSSDRTAIEAGVKFLELKIGKEK